MCDNDTDAEALPTRQLNAIAAFPHGSRYVLSLMDDDGELHTFELSGPKLCQVSTVIVNAAQGIPSGTLKLFE